jgi:hypothetical protein
MTSKYIDIVKHTVLLKGLSHQIFKSFLSSMILNQYFLYGR